MNGTTDPRGEPATTLAAALSGELSGADYHRLAREVTAAGAALGQPLNLSLLGTWTMDFMRPFLIVEGARRSFQLTSYFGPFGQVEQQIADPGSPLHARTTDVLVLAMRPDDVAPETLIRPFAASKPANMEAVTAPLQAATTFSGMIGARAPKMTSATR